MLPRFQLHGVLHLITPWWVCEMCYTYYWIFMPVYLMEIVLPIYCI